METNDSYVVEIINQLQKGLEHGQIRIVDWQYTIPPDANVNPDIGRVLTLKLGWIETPIPPNISEMPPNKG